MKFDVVGTGPGGPDYLLPVAARAIENADCLVGAPRLLAEHLRTGQDFFEYDSNLEDVLDFLAGTASESPDRKIAVLVSGDPGYHSLLGPISRKFDTKEFRVIPGVSSFQLAMARRGEAWQEDLLLSCHGRDLDQIRDVVLDAVGRSRRVILLTDRWRHPAALARDILSADSSMSERRIYLAEDLALPDERFAERTLGELASAADGEYRLCVMIIE